MGIGSRIGFWLVTGQKDTHDFTNRLRPPIPFHDANSIKKVFGIFPEYLLDKIVNQIILGSEMIVERSAIPRSGSGNDVPDSDRLHTTLGKKASSCHPYPGAGINLRGFYRPFWPNLELLFRAIHRYQ